MYSQGEFSAPLSIVTLPRQEHKQANIIRLNKTQRHITQLDAQKRMSIELITDLKFKQFREDVYGEIR